MTTAAVLLALTLPADPVPAGGPPAGVMSSAEFLKTRPFWPEWERSGEVFTVEGRVRAVAGGTLRLENVPLTVRPAAGASLGRADNRTARVEVTGRLAAGAAGRYLQATGVRVVPSDAATFTERKLTLDRDDPAALEGLAAWAAARAAFYDDPGLAAKARDLRREAFARRWDAAGEAKQTPEDAPAGAPAGVLAQLALLDGSADGAADGAAAAAVDRAARAHEALRDWWRAVRDDPAADLPALGSQIRARLPGAKSPPETAPPADLTAAYDRDPAGTYAAAAADRPALARRFLVAVERTRIERSAAADGRDGFEVAEELAARVPELTDLAEQYRERALAWRVGRAGSSTRTDVVVLAETLRKRGEPDRAAAVLAAWLAARERSLRAEGIGGLVRAAEEYRDLAGDDAAAVRLLREAYGLAAPGSAEQRAVAAKLRAAGLRRAGGAWRTAAEAAALPVDPVEAAVRDGRVVVGMTAAQVRAALGEPRSKARSVSRTDAAEVWVYAPPAGGFSGGLGGGGALVVHFSRPKTAPPDEAAVTAVHKL